MNKYFESIKNDEIRQYLELLSPEFPEWLLEYIYTPEMLRLDEIGMSCGREYTKIYNDKYFYSILHLGDSIEKFEKDIERFRELYENNKFKLTNTVFRIKR